jgi:hypothetical protein
MLQRNNVENFALVSQQMHFDYFFRSFFAHKSLNRNGNGNESETEKDFGKKTTKKIRFCVLDVG